MPSLSLLVALAFGLLAIWIKITTPSGVIPPIIPENSPTKLLPPWPIFRPAVAINGFFVKMAELTTPPDVRVLTLATSYWRSEVVYALTKNNIIDWILDAQVDTTCQNIAAELDLDPHVVCEYTKAAHKMGLLLATKTSDGQVQYGLSDTGALLASSAVESLRDFVLMINEETYHAWRATGTQSIQKHSHKSGFEEALGKSIWEWHNEHPVQEAQFDRAMTSLSFPITGAFLGDWKPHKENALFCDVGGGVGTVAAHVLEHYPNMSGMVMDQPSVVERATSFAAERGLSDRIQAVGGSFFDPLPVALSECDVFFLKFIIHDWPDEESIRILRNVRAVAKKAEAKIVLVEHVLETTSIDSMELTKHLMSINMAASCPSGARERNLSDYAALFSAAGITKSPELTLTRGIASIVSVTI